MIWEPKRLWCRKLLFCVQLWTYNLILKIKFILNKHPHKHQCLNWKISSSHTHLTNSPPNISVLLEDISTHIFTHLSTKTLAEIVKTSVFLLENISTHIFARLLSPKTLEDNSYILISNDFCLLGSQELWRIGNSSYCKTGGNCGQIFQCVFWELHQKYGNFFEFNDEIEHRKKKHFLTNIFYGTFANTIHHLFYVCSWLWHAKLFFHIYGLESQCAMCRRRTLRNQIKLCISCFSVHSWKEQMIGIDRCWGCVSHKSFLGRPCRKEGRTRKRFKG